MTFIRKDKQTQKKRRLAVEAESKKRNSENAPVSSKNLLLGSADYQRQQMASQGLDAKEQDLVFDGKKGRIDKNDFGKDIDDIEASERIADNASYAKEMTARGMKAQSERQSVPERQAMNIARNRAHNQALFKKVAAAAASTPSKADDIRVEKYFAELAQIERNAPSSQLKMPDLFDEESLSADKNETEYEF